MSCLWSFCRGARQTFLYDGALAQFRSRVTLQEVSLELASPLPSAPTRIGLVYFPLQGVTGVCCQFGVVQGQDLDVCYVQFSNESTPLNKRIFNGEFPTCKVVSTMSVGKVENTGRFLTVAKILSGQSQRKTNFTLETGCGILTFN